MNSMRGAKIEPFGRRKAHGAGAHGADDARRCLAAALVLSGCSSASTPAPADTANAGATSRFSALFSGSASPPAQAAAGGSASSGNDCPSVDIRTGAETYTVNGKPPEASATDVRYQLSFTDFARQCTLVGGNLVMKVGVQGRIIVGPIGGPGPVDIPLRYAVVQEGVTPRTIATKFKRVGAEVPPGQTNVVFSDVEEDLSFPMPSRSRARRLYGVCGLRCDRRRAREETRREEAGGETSVVGSEKRSPTVQAKRPETARRSGNGTQREASHLKIGGGAEYVWAGGSGMNGLRCVASKLVESKDGRHFPTDPDRARTSAACAQAHLAARQSSGRRQLS